jgi:hypothetical protein
VQASQDLNVHTSQLPANPAGGGGIDCRDLGQVFAHEGPLPHPAQNQPQ